MFWLHSLRVAGRDRLSALALHALRHQDPEPVALIWDPFTLVVALRHELIDESSRSISDGAVGKFYVQSPESGIRRMNRKALFSARKSPHPDDRLTETQHSPAARSPYPEAVAECCRGPQHASGRLRQKKCCLYRAAIGSGAPTKRCARSASHDRAADTAACAPASVTPSRSDLTASPRRRDLPSPHRNSRIARRCTGSAPWPADR